MNRTAFLQERRPEVKAGGFTRDDGTIAFYNRVQALITPNDTVLDLGAGRGQSAEDPVAYRRTLSTVRGQAACVIGVDPDPVVQENPLVDEALMMEDAAGIPLPTESVDLVLADWVFEHVANSQTLAREIHRVLRPGGWVCARTPNKHGYVSVGARIIPDAFHARFLHESASNKKDADVFPKFYRLNTPRAVNQAFPNYQNIVYGHQSEPGYLGSSIVINKVAALVLRSLPSRLAGTLLVFLHKQTT